MLRCCCAAGGLAQVQLGVAFAVAHAAAHAGSKAHPAPMMTYACLQAEELQTEPIWVINNGVAHGDSESALPTCLSSGGAVLDWAAAFEASGGYRRDRGGAEWQGEVRPYGGAPLNR